MSLICSSGGPFSAGEGFENTAPVNKSDIGKRVDFLGSGWVLKCSHGFFSGNLLRCFGKLWETCGSLEKSW